MFKLLGGSRDDPFFGQDDYVVFFSGQEDYEIITYGSLSENLKAHDLTWFMGAAKSNKYPIFPG